MTLRKGIYKIIWKNVNDDWYYFRVLKELDCGCIKLRGEYDPELDAKHDGDEFYVRPEEIKEMFWRGK